MAQFDNDDLADLMPVLLVARLDPSGVMDEVRAARAISNVIDRHVERALAHALARADRGKES